MSLTNGLLQVNWVHYTFLHSNCLSLKGLIIAVSDTLYRTRGTVYRTPSTPTEALCLKPGFFLFGAVPIRYCKVAR